MARSCEPENPVIVPLIAPHDGQEGAPLKPSPEELPVPTKPVVQICVVSVVIESQVVTAVIIGRPWPSGLLWDIRDVHCIGSPGAIEGDIVHTEVSPAEGLVGPIPERLKLWGEQCGSLAALTDFDWSLFSA